MGRCCCSAWSGGLGESLNWGSRGHDVGGPCSGGLWGADVECPFVLGPWGFVGMVSVLLSGSNAH